MQLTVSVTDELTKNHHAVDTPVSRGEESGAGWDHLLRNVRRPVRRIRDPDPVWKRARPALPSKKPRASSCWGLGPATLGKLPVQRLKARPGCARDRLPGTSWRKAIPVPGDPGVEPLSDGLKGKNLRTKARRLKLVHKVERPRLGNPRICGAELRTPNLATASVRFGITSTQSQG